jgi:hypothetical protein
MSNGDPYDPGKGGGGMGANLATSVELILQSHKAVQELLVALENVREPGGAQPLADVVRRAQTTRRQFQVVEEGLMKVVKDVKALSDSTSARNGQHIHLHFHF